MKNYYLYDTQIGRIAIAQERGLITDVCFMSMRLPIRSRLCESEELKEAYCQIEEYLSGDRREFDLPINPSVNKRVQKYLVRLLEVPYGTSISYKEFGQMTDTHPRAVGMYLSMNPIPIIIPCHRVVGSKDLGGYVGGVELKRKLLELEGAI